MVLLDSGSLVVEDLEAGGLRMVVSDRSLTLRANLAKL